MQPAANWKNTHWSCKVRTSNFYENFDLAFLIIFLPLLGSYSSWRQGVVHWNFSCEELDPTSA